MLYKYCTYLKFHAIFLQWSHHFIVAHCSHDFVWCRPSRVGPGCIPRENSREFPSKHPRSDNYRIWQRHGPAPGEAIHGRQPEYKVLQDHPHRYPEMVPLDTKDNGQAGKLHLPVPDFRIVWRNRPRHGSQDHRILGESVRALFLYEAL